MQPVVHIKVDKDPLSRRYRATCSDCGFAAVRSKREAAQHAVAQHAAYEHRADIEVVR